MYVLVFGFRDLEVLERSARVSPGNCVLLGSDTASVTCGTSCGIDGTSADNGSVVSRVLEVRMDFDFDGRESVVLGTASMAAISATR